MPKQQAAHRPQPAATGRCPETNSRPERMAGERRPRLSFVNRNQVLEKLASSSSSTGAILLSTLPHLFSDKPPLFLR
jgi:hypothetical protein